MASDDELCICPECDNEFDPDFPGVVEDYGLLFCCAACWEAYGREHDE